MSPRKKTKSFFARKKPYKKIPPSILIVCEDKKSEKLYFESLITKLKQGSSSKVDVVGTGATPDYIVKKALDLKSRRKESNLFLPYDDVWCVFDTEGPQYTPSHFFDAICLAEGNKIKLSISNPCFEFWILLHYTDKASGPASNCSEVVGRIKRENRSYFKGNCAIFDSLHLSVRSAIERAQYMDEKHFNESDGILDRNPSTKIYKLVEFLLAISSD